VGNGGLDEKPGAGPHFGIFALGHHVNYLFYNNGEKYLKNDCLIDPDMATDQWNYLKEFYSIYPNDPNEAHEREAGKLYGGILPLGSQGCTYLHAIVLNGPHTGCVVNLDSGRCIPPIFSYGANFLDWYEKWLDEVIDGTLQQPDAPLFGY
jgi:hypothetical protein